MKHFIIAISLIFLSSSCLKKIEEVETANTNIMDPDYAGGQWFVYDDVYTFTNSNNDQFVKLDFTIPAENAPKLKPTFIDLAVKVNGGNYIYTSVNINTQGDYDGSVAVVPQGETNYCVEIGVYVEEEDLVINSFSECKSL
ncbi:hypothetical protein K6119_01965 [Paracrocinitomix mangrovi]|uniref:hypothetical protein n=1 Tax=Paracrocinitomix mangrovi TaxID=2862509 RepID=UPI001C8DBC75|nr:hypothetical protein [Paracrocinitomix mangrovi]UKN02284.1 hypothetical protein K6119_01965 [Paracrocinitomix mangrovi]